MANGEQKPGDALADKWREQFDRDEREEELALTRLDVRADMKSMGEEEISSVIDQRALEARRKKDSEPPASKASPLVIVFTVAKKVPPWGAVIVILAGMALYAFLKTR